MANRPTLHSERLTLRPMTIADIPRVHELGGDKRVAEMTLLPHPFEQEAAEKWVNVRARRAEEGKLLSFSIVLSGQRDMFGHIGLALDHDSENAELFYWLGVPFWRRGYATEAAREVLCHAFEELKLRRVHADCFARNPASCRVLEKVGMQEEGLLRQHLKKWDRFEDLKVYGILSEEWLSQVK